MNKPALAAAFVGWLAVIGINCSWAKEAQQQLDRLSEIAGSCVMRQDTSHPLFHGCVDWHSAVHGHWALLYAAKKRHTSPAGVLKRLQPELIEQELNLMRAGDDRAEYFERPYGRAWFLQLARDSERFFADTRLHAAAEYMYTTLLAYARSGGGEVLSAEYDNACWVLYQLDQWAQYTGKNADRQLIREWTTKRLEAVQAWPDFFATRGFFDPKALALLLAESVDDREQLRRLEQAVKAESLQPLPMPFATAHQGGLNYSRAWGLWVLFRTTANPAYRLAYEAHLNAMMTDLPLWQADYHRYGHWVAQFGLFAHRVADYP